MLPLLQELKKQLENGNEAVLATVVESKGSTPRHTGAAMVVTNEGLVSGTIGGGAVEYRAILKAQEVIEQKTSAQKIFRLNKNDIEDIGMICGGDVFVEFAYYAPSDLETVQNMEYAEMEKIEDAGLVYIFGGGHVGQALVPILASVGFRPVVLEDRDEFSDPKLFPMAFDVRKIDNADVLSAITVTDKDYVCIMTRGHKDDYLIQTQILKTPARYIGVIGSRSKTASVFARLKDECGYTDADIARIHAPIGIKIHSETPAEIAISITAELIAARHE